MQYREFMDSLGRQTCPAGLGPYLEALWHEARGDWDTAHEIVQQLNDATAARIHAYLHRKEGDEWNSRYWHRRAGSTLPEELSLDEEWDLLVRMLVD
jgi:hypothetical protein